MAPIGEDEQLLDPVDARGATERDGGALLRTTHGAVRYVAER